MLDREWVPYIYEILKAIDLCDKLIYRNKDNELERTAYDKIVEARELLIIRLKKVLK